MSNGEGQQQAPEVQAAPAPGTAILGTATIDSLFTLVFGTRSADLVTAGTPTYSWGTGNQIIAQWPSLQVGSSPVVPNYSAIWCTFHARGVMGSSIAQ
jgi:hypothetical protein